MAVNTIDIQTMEIIKSRYMGIPGDLDGVLNIIHSIKRNTDAEVLNRDNLRNRIDTVIADIETIENGCRNIYYTLDTIKNKYRDSEALLNQQLGGLNDLPTLDSTSIIETSNTTVPRPGDSNFVGPLPLDSPLAETGAVVSKSFVSAADVKEEEPSFWKKLGASVANGVISVVKGLVHVVEAAGDLTALILSAVGSIVSGLVDIVSGISTGNWEWQVTKDLWKDTKSIVSYEWTNKLFGAIYNTKAGKTLDKYAYEPFKSDGIGCKILDGVGYVTGIIALSIVTFGAAGVGFGATATVGGISINAGAVAVTAGATGFSKYTAEEWNKNSISVNYGGTDLDIEMDYETYSKIENLKQGESTTITKQIQLEDGSIQELVFTIISKGNGEYDIIDATGNTVSINSLNESNTAQGLLVGAGKGLLEGLEYYTAISTLGNVQSFGGMIKNLGQGNYVKGFVSLLKNFGYKQSFKQLGKKAAVSTFKDIGFYIDSGTFISDEVKSGIQTGEWNFKDIGTGIFSAYVSNFLGNLGGEYFSGGLNSISSAQVDPGIKADNVSSTNDVKKFNTTRNWDSEISAINNQITRHGRFSVVEVDSFDDIPKDFLGKIVDVDYVRFKVAGEDVDWKRVLAEQNLSKFNKISGNNKIEDLNVSKVNSQPYSFSEKDLKYEHSNLVKSASNRLESNINRYRYTDTNLVDGLNDSIRENGLYHFSSNVDAIMDSGYVKSSGYISSYGERKSFFFNGVPEVGAYASNLDNIPLKTEAIRISPSDEMLNSPKLKVRNYDDFAVTYSGDLKFDAESASKKYFVLRKVDDKLVYANVNKAFYDNYQNTAEGMAVAEFISKRKNIDLIKQDYFSNLSMKSTNAQITFSKVKNRVVDSDNLVIASKEKSKFKKLWDELGGNQHSFNEMLNKKIKSSETKAKLAELESIVKKRYPNATKQDISKLANRIANNGCTYVASSNVILEQLNYDDSIFQKKFGYSMKNIDGTLNHDKIVVDMYSDIADNVELNIKGFYREESFTNNIEAAEKLLNRKCANESEAAVLLSNNGWSIEGNHYSKFVNNESVIRSNIDQIEQKLFGTNSSLKSKDELLKLLKEKKISAFISSNDKPGSKLTKAKDYEKWLTQYFDNNGIDLKVTAHDILDVNRTPDEILSDLQQFYNEGYSIVVNAVGGKPIWMTDGKFMGGVTLGDDGIGHAMTFRGISDSGDIMVSSWKKIFKISKEYLTNLHCIAVKIK